MVSLGIKHQFNTTHVLPNDSSFDHQYIYHIIQTIVIEHQSITIQIKQISNFLVMFANIKTVRNTNIQFDIAVNGTNSWIIRSMFHAQFEFCCWKFQFSNFSMIQSNFMLIPKIDKTTSFMLFLLIWYYKYDYNQR